MSVRFTCPHCSAPCSASDDLAGRPVRCGSCKGQTTAPPAVVPVPVRQALAGAPALARPAPPEALPADEEGRRGPGFSTAGLGTAARIAVWCLCIFGVLALLANFTTGSRHDISAIQQAARAADTIAFAVLGYVFCSAIDHVVRIGNEAVARRRR